MTAVAAILPFAVGAQTAFDAYTVSQMNLSGTARFMSMAGAFGALGGDISTLGQNPAGIGVYRSNDISATLGGPIRRATAGDGTRIKDSDFNFNNFGTVVTYRTGAEGAPFINFGFSYNRVASFNRHYSGQIGGLATSMSNYVAGQTNAGGWNVETLEVRDDQNPYQETNAPWMDILAYDGYIINANQNGTSFSGLFQNGTTGTGEFEVEESGRINEYNFSLGGNAYDVVYWGMTVGVTDLDYDLYSYYGESLRDAYVPYYVSGNQSEVHMANGDASWGMQNYYRMEGTGVNFKMGLIVKPINELRFGLAFHTPTFYSISTRYSSDLSYGFQAYNLAASDENINGTTNADEGYENEGSFDLQTPWRFIASAAAVVGGRGILSMDYERNMYPKMKVSYDGREDRNVTEAINSYYKSSNTVRVGGEFRVTPQFSLRAGYAYQSSPVTTEIKDDKIPVMTAGTTKAYTLDNTTQYVTAGLGYRFKAMYADLAYVYKNRKSDYHAFSPDGDIPSPQSTITDKDSEIRFTLGFRF